MLESKLDRQFNLPLFIQIERYQTEAILVSFPPPPRKALLVYMSVKAFNALPRKPRSPSGLPNHWHFDLRFVHLEPTPSHVLFLVQLDSSYIHSERLPLGIPATMSGMEFFPETGFEAAPEVAKALIHSFVDNFGLKKFELNPPPALAPWTLTTEDPQLAMAVGEELKKMGVRAELCKIHVVKGKALTTAQLAFDGFWKSLKTQIGITGLPGDVLTTPDSIGFANYRPATWVGDVNDDDTQKALAYAQRLSTTRPISVEIDPRDAGAGMVKEMQIVLELIDTKSTDQVRGEADAGNAEAAIDYALRYLLVLFPIYPTSILNFSSLVTLESNSASGVPPADNLAESIWSRSSRTLMPRRSTNPWPTPS
jgi:hypothetical protein